MKVVLAVLMMLLTPVAFAKKEVPVKSSTVKFHIIENYDCEVVRITMQKAQEWRANGVSELSADAIIMGPEHLVQDSDRARIPILMKTIGVVYSVDVDHISNVIGQHYNTCIGKVGTTWPYFAY